MNKLISIIIFGLVLTACSEDDPLPIEGEVAYLFEFDNDAEGWEGAFADYFDVENNAEQWEFVFERTTLPQPLNQSQFGLRQGANNRSDDMFMYIKRQITDLEPNTDYEVYFAINIASNVATNMVGIGGAPDAVMMKAGVVDEEPASILIPEDDNHYRINLDKGNQLQDGPDMMNLETIGVSDTTTQYTLITIDANGEPFAYTSNAEGEAWLCIGTDSGFEGRTELYYNSISVVFRKVNTQ